MIFYGAFAQNLAFGYITENHLIKVGAMETDMGVPQEHVAAGSRITLSALLKSPPIVIAIIITVSALAFMGGLATGAWLYSGTNNKGEKVAKETKPIKEPTNSVASNTDSSVDYADKIQILNAKASWANTYSGREVGVDLKVKNIGDKTVTDLAITVFFLDEAGNPIHEDDFSVASSGDLARTTALIYDLDVSPIRPNYIRDLRNLSSKNVPTDWKGGTVRAKVKRVELE